MTVGLLSLASAVVPASPFTLTLSYESSALAAPQSFRDGVQSAANTLMTTIRNAITVTIKVGYDTINGSSFAAAGISTAGSGGTYVGGQGVFYSTLLPALQSNATSADDTSFVNALPASSVQGTTFFTVPPAICKAIGLPSGNPVNDGYIGVGSAVPTDRLVGVALHELSHALGRVDGSAPFDLGRFSSSGVRVLGQKPLGSVAAYFSIDGGVTKLADYDNSANGDPADWNNTGVQPANDPFDAFYSSTTLQVLSAVDKRWLDVMGFTVV